jgi:predicted AAA+ superfamily ATPase
VQTVAADCATNRKTVENHFDLLEDLLLAVRVPVFRRRAARKLTTHPKFFFFDAGVFRQQFRRGKPARGRKKGVSPAGAVAGARGRGERRWRSRVAQPS